MSSQRLTLLCFAYAGGSSDYYSRWSKHLSSIRVIPVEIPGRGTVEYLPPLVTREELLDYLMKHYFKWCVPPFAMFGHSLGARIAIEFMSVLEQVSNVRATRLIVSGCAAPVRFAQMMRICEQDLSDSALLSKLRSLGGTPPELTLNSSRITAALPTIRADFRLAIDISKSLITPVAAPINLILGSEDKITSLLEDHSGWSLYTLAGCQSCVISGDHFFIRSRMTTVTKLVSQYLKEST